MRGAGYNEDDARILTDHVLDAALCGYEYSGLPKLLNVVDSPDFRLPRRPVTVVRETGPTAMLDGGNNTGMVAAFRATEAAIRRANAHGLAIVCLANTWMTGRSAYYCEMIAHAGLVAIHTVSSSAMVAPFGGARPALGTNPIAFGFPTEGDPLVIDMGTSAFMGTDLQFRARLGTPIPEGVALDADGRPTTDARVAQDGVLLPFGGPEGGYKGFGLALAMDALGALTAAMRSAELGERIYVHRLQARPVSAPCRLSARSEPTDRHDQGHAAPIRRDRDSHPGRTRMSDTRALGARRDRDRPEDLRCIGTSCSGTSRSRRIRKACCHDDC